MESNLRASKASDMLLSPRSWRVVGASVAGTRHLKRQSDCEDTFGFEQVPGGILLLAVADGAGSAAKAKEGARCAVQAALTFSRQAVTQDLLNSDSSVYLDILKQALRAARQAIEALVSDNSSLRDFATTLLFALVTPDWLGALQIGDGAIVIMQENASFQTLTKPDSQEYINECNYLTDLNYEVEAQYAVLPVQGIEGIAIFTDGLQQLALENVTNIAYVPFFTPFFVFVAEEGKNEVELESELQGFLTSERVCERTDDDKTLVLAISQSRVAQ